MKEIYLRKGRGNLIPADDEAEEYLTGLKLGEVVRCQMVKPRNYKNLQRFMTLVRLLYDAFEPTEATYKGEVVEKNLERFRHDLTILAGYSYATYNINGDVRVHAKSISFGSMTEDEFKALFSSVIDVGLRKIPMLYKTPEEVEKAVEDILRYA